MGTVVLKPLGRASGIFLYCLTNPCNSYEVDILYNPTSQIRKLESSKFQDHFSRVDWLQCMRTMFSVLMLVTSILSEMLICFHFSLNEMQSGLQEQSYFTQPLVKPE